MIEPSLARTILLSTTLIFVAFFTLKKEQDKRLNWSIFFAFLYTVVSLGISNYLLVKNGYWQFNATDINPFLIPNDIFFVWCVMWGFLPVLFLKKKYFLLIAILLLWLDLLLMPQVERIGLLALREDWWLGEAMLIVGVFTPAFFWAYSYFYNKNLWFRALMQVVVMVGLFIYILPFFTAYYGWTRPSDFAFSSIQFQFLLIIAFPALMAVVDLVQKGSGTPFPYDPTQKIVRRGPYAYIQNPIQWSFTLIFIPLAIYHSSYFLLIGTGSSIAYVYGISNFQEYDDMEKRFGKAWLSYKKAVPKWYFSWKPKTMPKGLIYFDANCSVCTEIMHWFLAKMPVHLEVLKAADYIGQPLQQVTYVDEYGRVYKSVAAIAHALEHIHLGYASLAWFMRFPGILFLLQSIVDAIGFGTNDETCEHL